MGHRNSKGTVSIINYKGRVRLRWRYLSERYSINLFAYTKENTLHARITALEIEQDIVIGRFDQTLVKYGVKQNEKEEPKTVVAYFEDWVSNYKQMDCEKHTNYNSTRNMMRKWGKIEEGNIQKKLSLETNAAVTYNRRLTILKSFAKWLVKKGIWKSNPLEDINPKKVKKAKLPKRAPFNVEEIHLILEAIKNDTYTPKCSSYKHSHYYPFIYFLFKTGVRNAEAIGLRVSSIDLIKKQIQIKEVLARTLQSGSSENRVRKETKNGKERTLPLTEDLLEVLEKVIVGKKQDDLVFHSPTGKSIDDHNFQNRVFKKVLNELGISDRVLYACRHTFGSRCIDQGITPVMTAFLMGNNPETALRNYTHQLNIPNELPKI
jgi:integrase